MNKAFVLLLIAATHAPGQAVSSAAGQPAGTYSQDPFNNSSELPVST